LRGIGAWISEGTTFFEELCSSHVHRVRTSNFASFSRFLQSRLRACGSSASCPLILGILMHRSASVTSDGRTPRARLSIGYRHALPPPHRGGGGARSAGGVGATGATTRGRQGGMPGVIPHPESVLHRACPPHSYPIQGNEIWHLRVRQLRVQTWSMVPHR